MNILLNQNKELSLKERFLNLNFLFIFIIVILASIGCLTLYSVAGGKLAPWAANQAIRFPLNFIIKLPRHFIFLPYYYSSWWMPPVILAWGRSAG